MMTATQLYESLRLAFPKAEIESGPLGITLGPIRFQSGGGIAGNLYEWWICFPGSPVPARGPIRNMRDLRKQMQSLAVDIVRFADIVQGK